MYDDYPTIYHSEVAGIEKYVVLFIGLVLAILLVLYLLGLSRVFKKVNRSAISAWIPIYNLYTLVEICNLPKIYTLYFFIPFVNIFYILKTNIQLAVLFRKSKLFGLGLALLPFIYYMILAFSDSEYIGINLVAMEGKTTVEKIREVDDNKVNEIEKKVNDMEDLRSNRMNVSIGGGRYQKSYKESMLQVEEDMKVKENSKPKEEEKVDLLKSKFITQDNLSQNDDVKMPISDSDYITCPNCKTKLNKSNKVCYICGEKL